MVMVELLAWKGVYISGSWAPPNIGVMILGNYCTVTMDSFFY